MKTPTLLAAALLFAHTLCAQAPITYQYFYDASGRLTRVVDSTGASLQYTYDPAGNITNIAHTATPGTLSVLNFFPSQGGPGTVVNIQGLGFSSTSANDVVKFNGVSANVTAATTSSLAVVVPNTATTGAITVTVGGNTATSGSNFTVVATPLLSGITPKFVLAGQTGATVTVTGFNLAGATFSFAPVTTPPFATITSAVTSAGSATLTMNTANVSSSLAIVATNAFGSTSMFSSPLNTLAVLLPIADSDNDGLSNAQEIALGTDPLNPDSDGDGLPDGWEAKYGLNPLDSTDAGKPSAANDGLTNLQEFQAGTDPANPNRTVPNVTSSTPADGTTGQPANTSVSLLFNEAVLNPSQIADRAKLDSHVTGANVTLSAGGTTVRGTWLLSGDGLHLTFTPSSSLAILTAYTLTATGFRSLAGVPMSAPYTLSFTTSNQQDFTPPTVSRISPAYQMTGVPLNATFSVEFSEQIDTTTATVTSMYLEDSVAGKIPGRVVVDSTGRIATFIPTNRLPAGRRIDAVIGAAGLLRDLAGNSLGQIGSFFVTGFAPDITPPSIIANSPVNGDTGIGINAQVMLQFNKPIDEITAVRGVSVVYNGVPVPGSFSFQSNDTILLFTPSIPFLPGVTTVSTTPVVTDVAGNTIANTVAYSFNVDLPADTVGPRVTYWSPLHVATGVGRNASLQLRFNERINPISLNASTFSAQDSNTSNSLPGAITVDADRMGASFTPSNGFAPNNQYCWGISSAVTDLSGNPPFSGFGACFTTSSTNDSTSPAITNVSPPAGSTGVPLNTIVVAQSSEPLSAVSFQGNAVTTTLPIQASGAPLDLGLFPPGEKITLAIGGNGFLPGFAIQTLPDGSVFLPAAFPYQFANPDGIGYPQVAGGDSHNHFPGGGFNYDFRSQTQAFGFAGKPTTDTSDPAAIRFGAVVGTFSPAPSRSDWFLIGIGATVTIPPTAGGSHLYLAVNHSDIGFAAGSYQVNYAISATGTPALSSPITLSGGGNSVPGVSALSADGLTINFNPSAQLKPSTTYTIQVHNVTDYAGNPVTPFASTFTTSTLYDATVPQITSIVPANGATNVPTNSVVTLTFNEFMDPLTLTSTNVYLYSVATGQHIPAILTIDNSGASAAGAVVTFTPAPLMPSGKEIGVTVGGMLSFTGIQLSGASFSFTTAGTADTTPPAVVSVTPTDGAANLGLNTTVSLSFSKPLNPATVKTSTFALFTGFRRLDNLSVGISIDLRTVNLSVVLPSNSTITVVATHEVTDLNGNPLADFRSSFTTVPVSDSVRPSVAGMRPGAGTTEVPASAHVVLYLSKPLVPGTVDRALHVSQNGVIVPGTISLRSNNQAVEFIPAAPFLPNAYIQVFLSSTATDVFGNGAYDYQAQFTTAPDLTGSLPIIVNTLPGANSNLSQSNPIIQVQFSKPIDAATVNSANFGLFLPNGTPVAATVSLLSPTVAQITPAAALTPGTQYYYQVTTDVKDTTGLAFATTTTYNFITGAAPDNAQPRVSAITPPNTTTNVGTNAPIELRFNKRLDPLTISTSTIQVSAGGIPISPFSINFVNNSTQDVVLTPITALPDNTTINIAVNGIQDVWGNSIVPFNASFQTRTGVDLTSPSVTLTNPFNGAPNVATNSAITLQFDKPMDPVTLNSASVQLFDGVTGLQVAGTYSTSPNGMTGSFSPATLLAVGRVYNLYWNQSAVDLVGNRLISAGIAFTAALTPPTTTPSVTLSSPDPGQVGVPINTALQVQFNESIQATSIQGVTFKASGNVVPGVVNTLSAGNTVLTVTPPNLLLANTSYSISIVGVQDLSGNTLTPSVTRSFTTGPGAELSYPGVIGVNPPFVTGVGTNIKPTIQFSKRMNPISLNPSTAFMQEDLTGQSVACNVVPSADRTSVTLQPLALLKPNTQYSFILSGPSDMIGNPFNGTWGFITGTGADNTAPTITGMNPPNGSIAPINTTLLFRASKPISPISFNPATAVQLTAGLAGVAGTAALSADFQTITFQPAANLTASTSYSVQVSGFTDQLGNLVTPFTGNFSTDNTGLPDTTAPTVQSITPADNATGVGIASTITLTFSKPIDPLTVNGTTVVVVIATSSVRIAGSYATNGSTVTFTPANPLPGNSLIAIVLRGVLDYAGNAASGATQFQFTTAAVADTTPPTVTSITPANNASGQGQKTIVVITFSESIDLATISYKNFALFADSKPLDIGVGYSNDWRIVTLSPGILPANSLIQVVVSHDVKDLAGNALADFQSTFTTIAAANNVRPTVVMQRPATGVASVPLNSVITLFFDKQMDPASTTAAFHVSQNGVLFPGNAVVSGNGRVLTFTPSAPFTSSALVQVFLSNTALDTLANQAYPYSSTFTTVAGPTAAPVVTADFPSPAVVPLNPVIEIQYNKPIDAATVTSANAGLKTTLTEQNVPVTLSLRGDRTIRMIPVAPLDPDVSYNYYAGTGITDTTGVSPVNLFTHQFTTGTTSDLAQPRVLTVTPPDTSIGVGVNAPVYLHFSEALNPLTVSVGATGSIQLTANGNPIAPASISFGSGQDVIITPYATFPDNTAITVTATSALEDPSGNPLLPFSSTFTTRVGPALSNPNVTSASPPNGAANVPRNTYLQLTTDTAMDPSTVNIHSFSLVDLTAGGGALAGTWSTSPDGKVLTFVPSADLAASHVFEYEWSNAMRDINGNGLNGGGARFTSSASVHTASPAVLVTNPPNGDTGVPTNLMVQILFDEPVQASSVGGVTLTPSGGSSLSLTTALTNANQTLTLIPPALLKPSTAYTLTIAGIVDVANNALAAPVTVTFTTGPGPAIVAPAVTATNPAASATNVSTAIVLTATVAKPVNPLSLSTTTVTLYQGNFATTVNGTASISADRKTITFSPSAPLTPQTVYHFYLQGLTDMAGNTLQAIDIAFTTGN